MHTHTLYENDFYQWTQEQAVLLRASTISGVDVVHLSEEIEDMGNSQRRAVESFLSNVIMHLLNWVYQPDRQGNSWRLSIRNGRHQLAKRLRESPSLKPYVPSMIIEEYPLAREHAAFETGLPLATFPEACPFTIEQILEDYWPD